MGIGGGPEIELRKAASSHRRHAVFSPTNKGEELRSPLVGISLGIDAYMWGGVCNQLLINRYMWPEGPWQRQAAALVDSSGVLPDHILSQIEMIDPSRAPLSPAPKNRRTKEKVK